VAELSIEGGSVSTSGNGERGIVVEGERLGHILDPRTGAPAPDFGSLTVWTADPLRADCLSTGLYVLGPEWALAWAAAHPGVEVLVLRTDGGQLRALASPGLRGRLRSLDPELEIEFKR
jgi:thiamine biosynthesis lipoprotein